MPSYRTTRHRMTTAWRPASMMEQDDAWANLAAAIIKSALQDYERLYRAYRRGKINENQRYELNSLARTLASDWFDTLSDGSIEDMVKRIQAKVENQLQARPRGQRKR